ncbi:hypothetical protein AVEN_6787-1 [Araneus ventricosus]|uniref:Integrase zinc-binding domain-containing protein n=1 Tax=Araneus ventricosus TaxID=182803 RepID=A0A4Y2LYV0_ARAVE|nr:hypothetical protein AVEN_6787-1 [Araneus ventricosus]
MEIIEEQLKDEDFRKIIHCFENDDKDVNHANWLEGRYLMNQGVLCRYSHDSENEEAQLIVPTHERDNILKEHHDSLNAAHYGSDGTYRRITKRYFWIAECKEVAEQQYLHKECGNRKRRRAPNYFPGDQVFFTTHHLSNAAKGRTTKFMPKRDGHIKCCFRHHGYRKDSHVC